MKARLPKSMTGGAQNTQSMLKQAQKMQQDILNVQEEIENLSFSSTAGGGAVEITMNGHKKITALTIKPEAVDKDDVEMLQDLIISAVNDCVDKIESESENRMEAVTGGVSFPGLF